MEGQLLSAGGLHTLSTSTDCTCLDFTFSERKTETCVILRNCYFRPVSAEPLKSLPAETRPSAPAAAYVQHLLTGGFYVSSSLKGRGATQKGSTQLSSLSPPNRGVGTQGTAGGGHR